MSRHLIYGLIIGAIIIAVVGFFLALNGNLSFLGISGNKSASVSGIFDVNGVVPAGATISIADKNYGANSNLKTVVKGGPAVDGAAWAVNGLQPGKTYEFVASVVLSDGTLVAKSDSLVVTAPASEESLTINIPSVNGTSNAVISGNITVNGYIPSGSSISVMGRVAGKPSFSVVASGLPGQSKQFMSYTTATSGESYEVYGVLYNSSNQQIGTSPVLVVTAPAVNEVLTVNSQAAAPITPAPTAAPNASPTPAPASSTITGSINFNGVAPANSRIVILQKVYNTSNYAVAVNNVSPSNGASWSWGGAAASTWYDIVAVLKQAQSNGTDIDLATSNMQSVAAPAGNIQFTINSGVSIPAPSGQVSMLCNNQSGNQWAATLTMPFMQNAQTYWYQVGSTNGASDRANATQGPNGNNSIQANVSLNSGQTYFFQYAYAFVPNVGTGNSQFSPFSSTSQGTCGN